MSVVMFVVEHVISYLLFSVSSQDFEPSDDEEEEEEDELLALERAAENFKASKGKRKPEAVGGTGALSKKGNVELML